MAGSLFRAIKMITLSVSHYGDRDADEHRGRYQHQDAAAQRLDNPMSGTRCLRIAQSAILGEEKAWHEESSEKAEHAGESARFTLAIAAHWGFLLQV